MSPTAARVADAVARLRADLRKRYPVVVDDTRWSMGEEGVAVTGSVLVAGQALAYQKAIAEALGGVAIADVPRPVILTALETPWTLLDWARLVGSDSVDLHGGPDAHDLQTQWAVGAWVRRFLDDSARPRVLVQLPDGTVGWVDRERLATERPPQDPWGHLRRTTAGAISEAKSPLSQAARVARGRLGRPYLWGGNTDASSDCSGFVQSVVHEAGGVLLPKNTRDQMKRGVRVARGNIDAGDIVFVKGREKALMHVGLALPAEAGGISVIHSCLSRARVLEEPLVVFLERYRFVGARRVLDWGAP